MATTIGKQVLTEELLERIGRRAAEYDRENRFFTQDLTELREIGYLNIAVPSSFGGLGLSLPEVISEQHAVEGAKQVVDLALKIEGAGSMFKSNELERLYRDVQAGAFHPPNTNAVYDVISRTYLGILKDEDLLKPDAIAETYWHLAHQDRSAWTLELEVRPFKEKF
jgi:alkylation response protein AidB-like acyl-CoA dehydrogenase